MAFDTEDYICCISKDPPYFEAESKLCNLLSGKESFIKAELERSESVELFCQRLSELVFKLRPEIKLNTNQLSTPYFKKAIQEIRGIGWDKITKIDTTLSYFEIVIYDSKRRKIEIRFDLPTNFPYSPPTVNSNLPVSINFDWDPQSSKISSIVDLYQESLPSFDTLWTQLEDLDKNTFIIDPHVPTLNCCMRMIYLNPQLWIQIEVKPLRAQYRPIIKFKGSDQAKREMQHQFDENVNKWDVSKTIRENLEAILNLKFPKRADEECETEIECPICFCERFGGELPEIVCENPKCAKHYHRSCLVDWLRENRKMEQSFHCIYGTCPNCGAKIQVDDS